MAGKNNRREEVVQEVAEQSGWEVLGSGWPDFMMVNNEKVCVCVEVKSQSTHLSKSQRRMHKILTALGLHIKVIKIGGKCRKKTVRRQLVEILGPERTIKATRKCQPVDKKPPIMSHKHRQTLEGAERREYLRGKQLVSIGHR